MIKRLLTILMFAILFCVPAVVLSGHSSAVNIFGNTCDQYQAASDQAHTNPPSVCQDVEKKQTDNPIVHILKAAILILSYVVGIAAVIGILVSGIRLITSNGDSSGTASARTGLIYSLIGIAVAVLAQAIVVFVLDKTK